MIHVMTDEEELKKTIRVTEKTRRAVHVLAWLSSQYDEDEASARWFGDRALLASIEPLEMEVCAWWVAETDSIDIQYHNTGEDDIEDDVLAPDGTGYSHLVLPGIRPIVGDDWEFCPFLTKGDIEKILYERWLKAVDSDEKDLRLAVGKWKERWNVTRSWLRPDQYMELPNDILAEEEYGSHTLSLLVSYPFKDYPFPRLVINIDGEPSGVELEWSSCEWLRECLTGKKTDLPMTVLQSVGRWLVDKIDESWKENGNA